MSDHGGAIFNRGQTYMPALLRELGLLVEARRPGSRVARGLRRGVQAGGEALHWALPQQLKMRLYNHPLTRGLVERFFARSLTAGNDWSRTRAYCYYWETAPWVNLAGREPQGLVSPGAEYEGVRDLLIDALGGAWDEATGEPAVERAYRREEVYSGPCLEYMPDVGVWWNRRVPLYGPLRLAGRDVRLVAQGMDVAGITGGHDPLGSLALSGPGVDRGVSLAGARIEDLAPTILALLGQAAPAHMEGAPLGGVRPPATGAVLPEEVAAPLGEEPAYAPGEEQIVDERLRNLGYL
jgi:predicted AlkP superfamily phosphohydrolase/phosphomutase